MEVLGPKEGYVDMLNAATIKRVAEQEATKKFNPLRPSSAGKCTRELAYELMEFHGFAKYPKEARTAETQRIFGLGHHIERHVLDEFKFNLPTVDQKYAQQVLTFFRIHGKTNPKLSHLVEGSLDSCFFTPEGRGVIDMKSKKDRFSQFYRTSWDETDEKLGQMKSVQAVGPTFYWVPDLKAFLAELKDPFFEQNFVQLNGYACTEFLRERGVDHGAIIQSNKNDSRLREIRFKPSMELFQAIQDKFQKATDAADAKDPTLAPRDHMLGSIKCKYCPFKNQCWPGKNVDKAFYDTLPRKEWPRDTDRMGIAGGEIEKLMVTYRDADAAVARKQEAEDAILKLMMDKNVDKIRTDSGDVYLIKELKDGIVLRRGKL
jgi:hypothetical protein